MVKSYLTILLLAFGFWSLQAQCPTGDVTLTSQAEVDAFAATYPNCTTITGHLIIQGADITDLSGLSSLTSILGLLSIGDNVSLMDLDGLSGITSIFDGLDILFNASLTDLNGLSALTSVGGALNIVSNASLTDISGLSSVNSIGGVLNITDNDVLTNLNGLSGITSITGVVMVITDNDVLTDISGLENIDATTITQLFIQNNPQLANCAIMSICDYLGVEMNAATISDNATGCATRMEVETACTPTCPTGDVFLSSQAEVDAFVATYPNCTEITGNMTIGVFAGSTDITDISGLSSLTSIGGSLRIGDNVGLTSMTGLDNLASISGDVFISFNVGLTSMMGLDNLASIGGFLDIRFNDGLTNLTGLEQLDATTITELTIQGNPQLSACAIESICGYLGVAMNAASISDNATGCTTRMEVEMACTAAPAGDLCTTAFDVNPLLGQGINQPQISTLLDNTDNAASDTPAAGFECHFEMDTITNSLWVSFMGDGNTYRFTTITCSADSSFLNDTQMALYSGTCDNLTPVTCNEDEDEANSLFNAEINQFTTLDGTAYFLLLDGYGGSTGEFCLEVTQQITVSTTDISQTNIELFPNPTNGRLQLRNITAEHVDVFTSQGQRVARYDNPGQELDLSALPAGVYHLHLIAADGAYVAKVVKR